MLSCRVVAQGIKAVCNRRILRCSCVGMLMKPELKHPLRSRPIIVSVFYSGRVNSKCGRFLYLKVARRAVYKAELLRAIYTFRKLTFLSVSTGGYKND